MKVYIGMPIGRIIEAETHFAVLATVHALYKHGVSVNHGTIKGSSIVEVARSRVCEEFLKSDATHLFMIDSDQTWQADDFLKVLRLATVLPVVCGAYPIKREPVIYYVDRQKGPPIRNAWGCVKINGIGLGFTCVQRKVIEQLTEKAPKLKMPQRDEPMAHIFRNDTDDQGNFRGEDMAFFADLRALGHEIWLEPHVQIGHIGLKEYKGNFMDGFKDAAGGAN